MGSGQDPAIGIDLGTTSSCVAVYQKGKLAIIANDEGHSTTASCVAFTDTGRLIGNPAKSRAVQNPENTIFDSKRMLDWNFCHSHDIWKNWQFKVGNERGKPKIRVETTTKTFAPEEISAMVLTELKRTAESHFGQKVTEAVISVPACFNESQRLATLNAARIAGLDVIRLISEPLAAALTYKVRKNLKEVKNVLVFDLGGGKLDVSLIHIDDDWRLATRATSGDSHLGGEDFDGLLVDHFVREFKTKHKRDLGECPKALRRLRIECEKAKRALSSCLETRIDLSCLFEGIDFHSKLTRVQFEDMCMHLFTSIMKPVGRVLSDAELNKKDIDEVILVGGSTRIPKVRDMLKDFFDGKEPLSFNQDEVVACGAAVLASVLHGRTIKNSDLGQTYSLILVEVAPLSLGIEAEGGDMSVVIKRNTEIPWCESRIFTTDVDNQVFIDVQVYEGEQDMVEDNRLLGRYRIHGIPPRPKKVARIEVQFMQDLNGILLVSAKSLDGSSESIEGFRVVKYKDGLSSEEIERMRKEARVLEREEEVERDRKSAWNELEVFVYCVKESMEFSPDCLLPDKKEAMALCESFMDWMDGKPSANTEEICKKMNEAKRRLNPFMMRIRKASSLI